MKKTIIFLIFLSLIFGYFFLNKDDNEISYITTKLKKGDIIQSVEASGEVYARDLIDVGAQVGGQIKKLFVKLGDRVNSGDMIAQIDMVTQQNSVDKEKAQLEIYKANLNSALISEKISKTQYYRELNLLKSNASSKEDIENAKNTYALNQAKVKEIKSQIKQTQIELDTANTKLGYTKISAPISGTIVSLPVEEGKTINANQTTPTIAKLADLTKMEIKLEIAEGDILKIKKGMKVYYTILSSPKKFVGTISSIDPALTTLSDGSYNKSEKSNGSSNSNAVYFYASVLVDNLDNTLKIGMTTETSIVIAEAKNVYYLPIQAIKSDEKGEFVDTINGGKKYIKTGISDNTIVQIISGLNKDDEVILSKAYKKDMAISNKIKPPRF